MQLTALLYLFIMVCIGYAAKKVNLLPDAANVALPALLTNICYPAMILSTFHNLDIKDLISSGLTVVLITLVVTLLLYFIGGFLFRRRSRPERILFNFMLGIGNVTYVGIPLISIFFGAEGVSYAILHGVVQDVLIWMLYYPSYISKSDKIRIQPFRNPCLIEVMIGLIVTITQIELPVVIIYALDKLSSAASPIALIYLGITIAKYGLFRWVKSTPAIAASVTKVLIVPLVLFCTLYFLNNRYTTLLLCILFACPAPIMSIVWAEQYNGDTELSVNCCICSTLLYLVIISILLTVILHSSEKPPCKVFALTTAVPSLSPVTVPFLVTLTISVFAVSKVTSAEGVPAGVNLTERFIISPTFMLLSPPTISIPDITGVI
jgi:predicted permease